MTNSGIPREAADFYRELEVNNTKQWWQANKARWQSTVREPLEVLTATLEEEFGPIKLYRPNRDVRFSPDKSPYKDHQGALAETTSGAGYYLQINGDGLMVGSGWYGPSSDQLARYRDAVANDVSGAQLVEILTTITAAGNELSEPELKRGPRGYPADHPRADLLKHKTVIVMNHVGTPDWMDTDDAVNEIAALWRNYTPLLEWHSAEVGAMELPDDRGTAST